MKKSTLFHCFSMAAVAVAAMSLTSCSDDDENTPSANQELGIPSDSEATASPEITNPTVVLPNSMVAVKEEKGFAYLSIDMTGVWDEANNTWLKLAGTADKANQNVWVEIDGKPKGIDVYNVADDNTRTLLADVVFLVDNSGSMSEEADAVANSIVTWAETLAQSGLDLRLGCVGYGDTHHAIDGALNLTTADEFKTYLDKYTGTYRTHHYAGEDAYELQAKAENSGDYENGEYNECGMVALHFANDNYNFRGGANRIYVNFTDEPNQPGGVERWSVEDLNPENNNWRASNGTVHTVYSGYESDDSSWTDLYYEKPWLMSVYTGGSNIFVDSYASDWDLTSLPVTGAMQNSSLIRCTNLNDLMDGQSHAIKITVQSVDRAVRAEKVINFNFTTATEE